MDFSIFDNARRLGKSPVNCPCSPTAPPQSAAPNSLIWAWAFADSPPFLCCLRSSRSSSRPAKRLLLRPPSARPKLRLSNAISPRRRPWGRANPIRRLQTSSLTTAVPARSARSAGVRCRLQIISLRSMAWHTTSRRGRRRRRRWWRRGQTAARRHAGLLPSPDRSNRTAAQAAKDQSRRLDRRQKE